MKERRDKLVEGSVTDQEGLEEEGRIVTQPHPLRNDFRCLETSVLSVYSMSFVK